MSENQIQFLAIMKLLWLVGYAALYGYGGISNKWLRRILGAAWMTCGVALFASLQKTWDPWYLTVFLMLFGSTSLGYGVNSTLMKWFKRDPIVRLVVGVFFGFTPLSIAILGGQWGLFWIHFIFCLIIWGVFAGFNWGRNAREQETLLATQCNLLTLFML